MAQIANRTGNVADGQNYTRIAHDYITRWQKLGINYNDNPPHTTFNYGNTSSYSLLYNLYSDRELGLQLVPQSVYDMQSTFYPTKFNTFGVPLDTRHTYTKSPFPQPPFTCITKGQLTQYNRRLGNLLRRHRLSFNKNSLHLDDCEMVESDSDEFCIHGSL